ncbi:MAG: hypothetical protein J5797_00050 [Prevotella sp.]|nr:hypothetical protein [Prevotella sp.]
MNKKYIKPNIEVVNVRTQQMIANSLTSITGLDGVTLGGEFTGGGTDARLFEDDSFDFDDFNNEFDFKE